MGKLIDWQRLDRHIDDCNKPIRVKTESWIESLDPDTQIDSDIQSLATTDIGRELAVLRDKYLKSDGNLRSIRSFLNRIEYDHGLARLTQLQLEFRSRLKAL